MMTKKEIDQLTRQIYEEYIFGGTGRPTYGIDFDKRHILQALEMMVHKTNEYWLAKNLHKPHVMGSNFFSHFFTLCPLLKIILFF